jgi:hypothetical protein
MCTMNRSRARENVISTSLYSGAFGAPRCANGCRSAASVLVAALVAATVPSVVFPAVTSPSIPNPTMLTGSG